MTIERGIAVGGTDKALRSFEQTTSAGVVQTEAVSIADPTDPAKVAGVATTTPGDTDPGVVVRVAGTPTVNGTVALDAPTLAALESVNATITNESGTWGYRSGITGTPSIPAGARVLSISAIAPADTPASFTVDGGNAITIPGYQNFSLSPKGNLIAPVLVFTGTESYVVEFVT